MSKKRYRASSVGAPKQPHNVFQLDDPNMAAVNEPLSADEQHALDAMLSGTSEQPKLLPLAERTDSKLLVTRDDERVKYEHALDLAPDFSKVVLIEHGAVIATPERAVLLTPYDPANQLPRTTKIVKVGPGHYRVEVPNAASLTDNFEGSSVIATIAEALHSLHG